MLIDKFIDLMPMTQDKAASPLSMVEKEKRCQAIKDLGATGVAISCSYDVPAGFPDAMNQVHEWIQAAKKFNLSVWNRSSWCSDEGWNGVPKQTSNDRINDTVNWIKSYNIKYPGDFANVKFFTPKPEPQNMGIMGVNTGSNARFASKAAFNKWLRDMLSFTTTAFNSIGSSPKIGYWGFDGFITCGFGNPDHQGTSVLEASTVTGLGNLLIVDHYPPQGTTMAQFLQVFKQTWPGVKMGVGEYGTTNSSDKPGQLKGVLDNLNADPIFSGFFNYWNLDGGPDVALLTNGAPNAIGDMLKSYYGTVTPPIPPIPPTSLDQRVLILEQQMKIVENRLNNAKLVI